MAERHGVWFPEVGEQFYYIVVGDSGKMFVEKSTRLGGTDERYISRSLSREFLPDSNSAQAIADRHNAELEKVLDTRRWKPVGGDYYYYIGSTGRVLRGEYPISANGFVWNETQDRIEIGNYFRTEQAADVVAEDLRRWLRDRTEPK